MKFYRIIKSSQAAVSEINLTGQVADVSLKADSYEKALLSFGARKPFRKSRISRGILHFWDADGWQYLIAKGETE